MTPKKYRLWNCVKERPERSKMFYHPHEVMECLKQQAIFDNDPNDKLGFNHEGEGSVFMQYTGLKDKNGVEIYEGDIVEVSTSKINKFEQKFKVEYNELEIRFEILQWWEGQQRWQPLSNNISYYQYEVIGNIYENPELLNK